MGTACPEACHRSPRGCLRRASVAACGQTRHHGNRVHPAFVVASTGHGAHGSEPPRLLCSIVFGKGAEAGISTSRPLLTGRWLRPVPPAPDSTVLGVGTPERFAREWEMSKTNNPQTSVLKLEFRGHKQDCFRSVDQKPGRKPVRQQPTTPGSENHDSTLGGRMPRFWLLCVFLCLLTPAISGQLTAGRDR
jgi:hypothetical protein